jgi:hypothetical protein
MQGVKYSFPYFPPSLKGDLPRLIDKNIPQGKGG